MKRTPDTNRMSLGFVAGAATSTLQNIPGLGRHVVGRARFGGQGLAGKTKLEGATRHPPTGWIGWIDLRHQNPSGNSQQGATGFKYL